MSNKYSLKGMNVTGDVSDAQAIAKAIGMMEVEFNSSKHLGNVTRAAFATLKSEFSDATTGVALAAPTMFHHVYEPQKIGIKGFELFEVTMGGTGGKRRIGWEWRASKQLIDPALDPYGNEKFPDTFDTSKLRKIHIFVWKAPVLEYGDRVYVSPKLSPKRVLVFPNPKSGDMQDGGAAGRNPNHPGVTFTANAVSYTPGKFTQGKFTAHFIQWFSGGAGQSILQRDVERQADRVTARAIEQGITKMSNKSKTATFSLSDPSTAKAETLVKLAIARRNTYYIEMARKRGGG